MTLKNHSGAIARMFTALIAVGLYWASGIAIIFIFMAYCYYWLELFRPMFYLPACIAISYLHFFRKNKGVFLESIKFLLDLSLTVLFTIELIIYI
jgi:hypothetical protein